MLDLYKKIKELTIHKVLRESIRIRDKYICQLCGKKQGKERKHSVHHIDYDENNWSNDNLITLCEHPCHHKTNTSRKYWKELFQFVMFFRKLN